MYRAEMERKKMETGYATREEFLRSCNMRLHIRPMAAEDIPRVRELMTRTHQLNTTGHLFDPSSILADHEQQRIFVAELTDKFGWYGIVGTSIVETRHPAWRLRYFAISCRVMGRGIERALLASMAGDACRNGCSAFEAEFRDTGRNTMMRALYQMMGFRDSGLVGERGTSLFRAEATRIPPVPRWVEVI